MPLSGGPADKFGNRYEHWWTVYQLIRILDRDAVSIRIEPPVVDKAEFLITTGNHSELHQAKRSHPNGKWSLFSLKDEGLLQAMFEQLDKEPLKKFVFVSSSDAPELRELTERARDAENSTEFESAFIRDLKNGEHFAKLRNIWGVTDAATAYGILRRIEVRTIDERGIQEQVRDASSARFLAQTDRVSDVLLGIVVDSIHRTINRDDLISDLHCKGLRPRRLTMPTDAAALVAEATDHYLETTRRRLIQSTLIPRSSTQDLLAKINENAAKGADYVLIGQAGGGKTGCAIEIVDALHQDDNPAAVLAFRLDRIEPVSSTQKLGECLGLEDSPAFVLATAAEAMSSKAVLVIDQLDAVSTTSGRRSDFFELVEDLLSEVRGWRSTVKFHVVVVCRGFDWENDHRLRNLLAKGATQISVTDFSLDEVKTVLTNGGFRPESFNVKQLELLGLPQNLALFLDTCYDPTSQPTFSSQKELFDRYWDEKRPEVNRRAATLSDYWDDIIRVLCDEMTASQQLSVLREKLDRFPNDFLYQMVSEGVLTFDGDRYGFGHEAFFDYCFARSFVARGQSLTTFLVASEQQLFRRAQVRQVLTYLRDINREQYCRQLHQLLAHGNVRPHLKDLAVALVFSLPDPDEDEWDVVATWIDSEIAAIKSDRPNSDKFASLVWNRFLGSETWFRIGDSKGLVTDWLTSDDHRLVEMGVNYVRIHQSHSGDRVAELLEPFVGKDGDWPQRLSVIMQWADLEHSRRFFNLFLALIDDGTLDNTRGPIAVNSTFWSMLYNLSEARPDWIAEVLAHWLRRRLSITRQTGSDTDQPNWHDLFSHDQFGSKEIQDSATKTPEAFVRHVLPVVLKIADESSVRTEDSKPRRDAVWPIFLFDSEYPSISDACGSAITAAVEKLAETKADCVDSILTELRNRDTYMANFLLLRTYTAGAKHFANDAVTELCNKIWRFDCGYSDSPYWVAMELIKAVAPICSDESRARLEQAILNYTPEYERTKYGYHSRGRASFALLSAIPLEFRSKNAQARYAELERKFEVPESPPRGIHAYSIDSPIAKTSAEKMTDGQWLSAIQKYDSEYRQYNWDNPEKGGASELGGMLQGFVKQEPERFARLSLKFPSGTLPHYLAHTLMGLKETKVAAELKLKVCRKAYAESRDACGGALADVLGSIEEPLPNDAVQMLDWLATEHPDPQQMPWHEQATLDLLGRGINTTRGRAAHAIRDLIQRDASYLQQFRSTIIQLVADNNAAVRACVGSILLAVINHDEQFALGQFLRLVELRDDQTSNDRSPVSRFIEGFIRFGLYGDFRYLRSIARLMIRVSGYFPKLVELRDNLTTEDRLLVSRYIRHFIRNGLHRHFTSLRSVVKRMLRANLSETSQTGARLASITARLGHPSAQAFVKEALRGNPSQRLGVAEIAAANIGNAEHRQWSEQNLLSFFNDDDIEVRREAATCFGHLKSQSLEAYENLISRFCNSPAYQTDSSTLLHALEKSSYKLPGITLVACEKFFERFGTEARDIRTHRAGDGSSVTKLVLRTYHQHQRDKWTAKSLDLIDQMCLERGYGVHKSLEEYER